MGKNSPSSSYISWSSPGFFPGFSDSEVVASGGVDLDHYKTVNDDYGHQVGDELLREVGRALRECCKDEELACRYGGEEFVVVVPGANPSGLAERAEQIRVSIARIELEVPDGKLGRTASVGASLCPQVTPSHHAEALVRAADRELYRAKSEGRDRVCITVMYG